MNKKGFIEMDGISSVGVLGAVIGVVMIFLLRGWMLTPFLVSMSKPMAFFWGAATYIGVGIAGYLIMSKVLEGN